MMRRLVVIRHGQTAWNAEHRFQGRTDTPLDETGRKQALEVAREVGPLLPGLILCSDLARARCTAAPLAAATGAEVIFDASLEEIDLGAWEGLDHAEAESRFPAEYAAWRADLPIRRGGGETEAEAGARAAAFISAQLARPDQAATATVAVVAHGTVLRAALSRLAEEGAIDLDGPSPRFANAEWRVFTWHHA
ncbi:MAG: histidine phosphatase family protein [Acidimicrobiaceae bacterium]|nr:histidine phosphatase family protein [Acidimicrobiaceae bacterium]